MKTTPLKLLLFVALLLPQAASAYVDFNMFYFTDAFKTEANNTWGSTFIEGSIGLAINKKKTWLVGWNYSMFTVNAKDSLTRKYSSTQMGPRFIYRFGRDLAWSAAFGYNLINDATNDDGSGSSMKWEGTGMKFDFGYSFPFSETMFFSVRGNYASASYNEQLDESDTYSKVSYSRTHMYPSLSILWLW